jgi:GWxTD domain-containing protein
MTPFNARRSAALFLALILFATIAQPQKTQTAPDEKPRKIKNELKRAYVDWIKGVDVILTEEDRLAWNKLKTNDEREQFIQLFWRQRDPDPDTVENEYKEQFYERVAYANEHFSSGKPGRLSDRGRIYIKFGKPDDIESHPSGGTYDRPANEGGGSTTTYPFEKWFYRHIRNVGSGIELEFVDPSGSGEYRLARNPDEKVALLPNGANGGYGRENYLRVQDSPFEVMQLQSDLERAPSIDRRWTETGTTTPIADDSAIAFDAQLNYFRQSDNSVLTALTLQADNSELVFENVGGLQTARLNIFGRITSVADIRIGKFEDVVITHATPEELSSVRTRKSAYAKAFVLQPGRYRIDLFVRDTVSGAMGVQHIGFEVPSFPANRLAASSIILAAKLESLNGTVATGPFAIGPYKVVPNVSATYTRGQNVGIYLQVYNSAIDQTTLRPAVDVEYVLLRDGKELSRSREDWRDINDAGQRLTLTEFIETQSLTAGEYEIRVVITDHTTRETISPTAKFTVVK